MPKTYTITLDSRDLGQVLDGLEIRAEAWEKTAEYLRTEQFPDGQAFIIEECNGPEEAEQIAVHYRTIIGNIRKQMVVF